MTDYRTSGWHTLLYLAVPGSTLPGLCRNLEARTAKETEKTDRLIEHFSSCIFPVMIEALKISVYSAIAGYYLG